MKRGRGDQTVLIRLASGITWCHVEPSSTGHPAQIRRHLGRSGSRRISTTLECCLDACKCGGVGFKESQRKESTTKHSTYYAERHFRNTAASGGSVNASE